MGVLGRPGWAMVGQFTPRGDGYVYRQGGKGPALPCSRAERDRCVGIAAKAFGLGVVFLLVSVIGAAMFTARFYPRGNEPGGFVMMGSFLLLIGTCLYLGIRWAFNAPARAFAGRTPV